MIVSPAGGLIGKALSISAAALPVSPGWLDCLMGCAPTTPLTSVTAITNTNHREITVLRCRVDQSARRTVAGARPGGALSGSSVGAGYNIVYVPPDCGFNYAFSLVVKMRLAPPAIGLFLLIASAFL